MSKIIHEKILYCAKTDRGLCRNVNQDAIAAFVQNGTGLFVLSDGMGGHSRGELASRSIVAEFRTYWNRLKAMSHLPDFQSLSEQVQQLIHCINQKIYEQYNQGQVCGATVVVLLIADGCYALFSVGDSRTYSYAGRKCSLLTVDDIWEVQPSTLSRYTEVEISKSKNRGKLLQAIGTKPEINIHVRTDRILGKQVFLLCSDGLYKFCDEKSLKKGLKKVKSEKSMLKAMDFFMKKVFENGAGDNVSATLVRVE